MGTRRLVADGEIDAAQLVVTELADRILDVEEAIVLSDPAVRLAQAAGDVVHAVGGGQGETAGLEVLDAVAGGDVLHLHIDGATGDGVNRGALAGDQEVVGVIRDVVGAAGLIDAEEVNRAAAVGDADADVLAVDRHGPVGDPVGVDLAAENAD